MEEFELEPDNLQQEILWIPDPKVHCREANHVLFKRVNTGCTEAVAFQKHWFATQLRGFHFLIFFCYFIFFKLKDKCFIEFYGFVSYINKNQP